MKVLSIRQPWAWLIAHADEYPDPKRVENRDWLTKFRGDFFIHAGKSFDMDGYLAILRIRPDLKAIMPVPSHYELGGIIGRGNIVDCVEKFDDDDFEDERNFESSWFFGRYGFVIDGAHPLSFIPLSGKLGFFDAPLEPFFKVDDERR